MITVYEMGITAILGAAVGSFLNVVAYRLPLHISLLQPGSRCPSCFTPLSWQENMPILGWFWLHGHCRHCDEPISGRYPLIESLTAGLFVLIVARWGLTWETPAYWLLGSLLITLSLLDLDTRTLPHSLTLPGIYLGLVWQMIAGSGWREGLLGYGLAVLFMDTLAWGSSLWLQGSRRQWWRWEPLGVGGLLGLGGLWDGVTGSLIVYGAGMIGWDSLLIWQDSHNGTSPEPQLPELVAMGGGDVLLAGLLGTWLGGKGVLLALAISFILGAAVGLIARASGWLKVGEGLPFGPFLALGSGLSLWLGTGLVDSYVQFLGMT